ncbi:MAG: hypothetical protein SF002_12855 [Alphaproteobacteria bacterium]|nr:hypothetical protein [Alphaproteobacteria bacterium]
MPWIAEGISTTNKAIYLGEGADRGAAEKIAREKLASMQTLASAKVKDANDATKFLIITREMLGKPPTSGTVGSGVQPPAGYVKVGSKTATKPARRKAISPTGKGIMIAIVVSFVILLGLGLWPVISRSLG